MKTLEKEERYHKNRISFMLEVGQTLQHQNVYTTENKLQIHEIPKKTPMTLSQV